MKSQTSSSQVTSSSLVVAVQAVGTCPPRFCWSFPTFLLAIDAHSKWGEVQEMSSTTAVKTVEVLRRMFAAYGLPLQIVTNNGPQFVSQEFADFMKSNGVRHTQCTPYHPASNGEAERFVRTFKESMKAGKYDGLSLSLRLQNFLASYRTTPHRNWGR